jgi:hypothetical protein
MTIVLDETGNSELTIAAMKEGVSKAQIVRWAVAAYYRQAVRGEPTCATDRACRCPERWHGRADVSGRAGSIVDVEELVAAAENAEKRTKGATADEVR